MTTPGTIEERLELAEKQLAELKPGRRDFWDKFQIVASLMIPASITIAGYLYSEAAKHAEITSSERIAAQQQATTQVQVKVGQAQLISTFMESLLSNNEQRQRLAIEAVLVALPEDGPRLVAVVSEDHAHPLAQAAAISSLDQRRAKLIQDCFSGDKPTRIRATTELVQGWQNDEKLVPKLLVAANQNLANPSGVINALVVLENVAVGTLKPHVDEVKNFLNSARAIGPQAASHVKLVEARLGG